MVFARKNSRIRDRIKYIKKDKTLSLVVPEFKVSENKMNDN